MSNTACHDDYDYGLLELCSKLIRFIHFWNCWFKNIASTCPKKWLKVRLEEYILANLPESSFGLSLGTLKPSCRTVAISVFLSFSKCRSCDWLFPNFISYSFCWRDSCSADFSFSRSTCLSACLRATTALVCSRRMSLNCLSSFANSSVYLACSACKTLSKAKERDILFFLTSK